MCPSVSARLLVKSGTTPDTTLGFFFFFFFPEEEDGAKLQNPTAYVCLNPLFNPEAHFKWTVFHLGMTRLDSRKTQVVWLRWLLCFDFTFLISF